MKPHKHAELIKAWADGAEIEFRAPKPNFVGGWYEWVDFSNNAFFNDYQYRIKPELKPDYVSIRRVFLKDCQDAEMENNALSNNPNNVKFIFDGETGELKSAEVLK